MIASYTANLAAFLTVEKIVYPIENAEGLAAQEKIKYGCLGSGSTASFFSESNITTYKKMWNFMSKNPDVFMKSNEQGRKTVEKADGMYAYLMESASIEYTIERDCNLTQIGGLLDSKGYGIATRKDSPYRTPLSQAILKLQESGALLTLKERWWKQKKGGGKCIDDPKKSSGSVTPLKIDNVGGVFVVLLGGLSFSLLVVILEFVWKSQYEHNKQNETICEEMMNDLKFALMCQSSSKLMSNSNFSEKNRKYSMEQFDPIPSSRIFSPKISSTLLFDDCDRNILDQNPLHNYQPFDYESTQEIIGRSRVLSSLHQQPSSIASYRQYYTPEQFTKSRNDQMCSVLSQKHHYPFQNTCRIHRRESFGPNRLKTNPRFKIVPSENFLKSKPSQSSKGNNSQISQISSNLRYCDGRIESKQPNTMPSSTNMNKIMAESRVNVGRLPRNLTRPRSGLDYHRSNGEMRSLPSLNNQEQMVSESSRQKSIRIVERPPSTLKRSVGTSNSCINLRETSVTASINLASLLFTKFHCPMTIHYRFNHLRLSSVLKQIE
ncbi:abhydrolase domain-containing protein [Sarcoptes scabiei]|nr:abhydrolase domain-containing protein [Sarcoptes scabiei]